MSRWGVETVDSLRGEIQSTRRVGSNDDQLANLATISRMLSRLRLWERRALVAYVTEESMHAAYSALSRRYPHRKAGWTYAGTREEIRKAQGKLESMLSRADLLS